MGRKTYPGPKLSQTATLSAHPKPSKDNNSLRNDLLRQPQQDPRRLRQPRPRKAHRVLEMAGDVVELRAAEAQLRGGDEGVSKW